MNRKKIVLVLAPLLVLGGVGAVAGPRWWEGRCEVRAGRVPADQALPTIRSSSAANPDLTGYSDSARNRSMNVLTQARRIPSSIGTLRSIVIAPSEESQAENDHVRLAGAAAGEPLLMVDRIYKGSSAYRVLTRIDTKPGGSNWARWYQDPELLATDTPDGLVAVQRRLGSLAPQAASVSPDTGDLQWCTSLGSDYLALDDGLDIASDDSGLFAIHSERQRQADREPSLVALDPATGKSRWEKRIDGFIEGSSVDVFGPLVLVTQWDLINPYGKTHAPSGRVIPDPVRALSTADGSAGWEYRGPDATGWSNTVMGVHDSTAIVLSRQTRDAPASASGSTNYGPVLYQNWLVGLGPAGKERWRHDLGNRVATNRWNQVKVAGDTVLTFETKDAGTTGPHTVVARDIATGKIRWTKHDSFNITKSALVGNNLILWHDYKELVALDLTTGVMRPLITKDQQDSIFNIAVDDRSLIIQTAGLVMTFDRESR